LKKEGANNRTRATKTNFRGPGSTTTREKRRFERKKKGLKEEEN